MHEWTSEQLTALEADKSNILLSAAAGSGKTTVLVERVLRLVQKGADIDRMLIVTFTRAASADMREKLARSLRELIAREPRYRKQQLLLERASISTLHSFCADFLRSNFDAAGIDPAFRLVSDTELADMVQRAMDKAMEEAYAEPSEGLNLLNLGRGPDTVREMALKLMDALDEQPDPEEWLAAACEQGDELRRRWISELSVRARKDIRTAIALLNAAANDPSCNDNYYPGIMADIDRLTRLSETPDVDFDTIQRELGGFSLTPAKRAKLPAVSDRMKKLRDRAKSIIQKSPVSTIPLAGGLSDADAIIPALKALGDIALRARQVLNDRKRSMGVLTYNDLEQYTNAALKNEGAADSVRQRFDYVFVDEYQDTSKLQEAIVSRIVREDNLFMVGDVKQSIYRFRHADPSLFSSKYEAYANGRGGSLLHLTANFRSCPAVLDFVNVIFEVCMNGGDSGILYDANARLNHGNKSLQGGSVEMHILKKPTSEDAEADEDNEEIADGSIALEGLFVARRILELKKADSSIKFSDIAVLSRSAKGVLSQIAKVLIKLGIPAYAEGSGSFYESIEVSLAYSLLKLIKNRISDIELIGVLHSPVVGVTVDELARIRIAYPEERNYCSAAEKYAAEYDDGVSLKLKTFYEKLNAWQDLSAVSDLGYFVHTVFEQSGLYNYVNVLPASAQRRVNLDRLVADAVSYESSISGSLTAFMHMLEQRKDRDEIGDVNPLNENDDVVRLMTIHKSKGLEFRIVFCVALSKGFSKKDNNDALSVHSDLGLACNYVDPKLRSRRKTLCRYAVNLRNDRENYAEELRILYVALTRAKEQLILVGSVKDPEAYPDTVWETTEPNNYLNIIMRSLAASSAEVCIINTYPEVISTIPERADATSENETKEIATDPTLTEAISWNYPYAADAMLPLKLSVSGVLRDIQSPASVERFDTRPVFMQTSPGKLTGSERGTAYHRVMQCLDLSLLRGKNQTDALDEVRRQMEVFRDTGRLRPVQHDAVKPLHITKFCLSEIGQRMIASPELHREWNFNASMNIADVLTLEERGHWGDGKIMVQGTIDACFLENGKWVLLDYKTNREDDAEAMTERYADQLRMYAHALRVSTGIPVAEIRLCLLMKNETIRIEL